PSESTSPASTIKPSSTRAPVTLLTVAADNPVRPTRSCRLTGPSKYRRDSTADRLRRRRSRIVARLDSIDIPCPSRAGSGIDPSMPWRLNQHHSTTVELSPSGRCTDAASAVTSGSGYSGTSHPLQPFVTLTVPPG